MRFFMLFGKTSPKLWTSEREKERQSFLQDTGWSPGVLLAEDAAPRRYFRLPEDAVLMDAPPHHPRPMLVSDWVRICSLLSSEGMTVPAIYAVDFQKGFAVTSDLGDGLFSRLLEAGEPEEALYTNALDNLIALQKRVEGKSLPPYDAKVMQKEVALLPDWYGGKAHIDKARTDKRLPFGWRRTYRKIWESLLQPEVISGGLPLVFVHRDYHVANLLLPSQDQSQDQGQDQNQDTDKCGMIDFQDALYGSALYDLVSLLEDPRRETPSEALRDSLKERYCQAFGIEEKEKRKAFDTAYNVLSAQRHCKVLGIFVRLALQDGKLHYLDYVPRCRELLVRSLAGSPLLTPLYEFLQKTFPELGEDFDESKGESRRAY